MQGVSEFTKMNYTRQERM